MCPHMQKKTRNFYLILGGIVVALVALGTWLLVHILNSSEETTKPGLSFRPLPPRSESTLILINQTDSKSWVDNLSQFLDKYYVSGKVSRNGRLKACSYREYPNTEEVCDVNVRDWGTCNRESYFNYYRGSPCIFLEPNKIYGWTPEYYDNPDDLPDSMPEQLKEHIRSIKDNAMRKNVWVSCEGENPADIEYIGPVTYYPRNIQGFPGYYFPYLNQEGYLSPLVAVRFERPTTGIVINVKCKAWAKNINRVEREGSTHFELLIN